MNWYVRLLVLGLFVLSCCNSPNYEKAALFLSKSNAIKRELDSLDRSTYTTYMSTFLDSEHSLYGNHSSNEYQSFISETTKSYNSLLEKLYLLQNHKSFIETKSALHALILFQKQGLKNYYTEILIQEKIDRTLDDKYNTEYDRLQSFFFYNQIQLANKYNVHITDSTQKTLN